jgi:hypothetical protein
MGQNISIRRVRPFTYVFPKIPFGGSTTGYDLPRTIPHIRTSEQRIALSLFREARASNNDYLSFLFLWQVLEVKGAQAVGFIDKIFRKHRHKLHLDPSYISRLPLAGRTLGSYLQENFRHAIAHIKRKPGKRPLEIDVLSERRNLAISTLVVEAFAEYFIREELSLGELSLARRRNGGIPVYADSSRIVTDRMIPARWPSTLPVRKKVSRSRKRA